MENPVFFQGCSRKLSAGCSTWDFFTNEGYQDRVAIGSAEWKSGDSFYCVERPSQNFYKLENLGFSQELRSTLEAPVQL